MRRTGGVRQLVSVTDLNESLIADDVKLNRQPLALLEAEIARLEKLVSIDRDTASKFSALSKRITEESAAIETLKEKLADCEGAKERAKKLVGEREAAYVRVFEAIAAEQTVLTDLYSPLNDPPRRGRGYIEKALFFGDTTRRCSQLGQRGRKSS